MAEIANNSIFSQNDSANTGALPGLSGASPPSQIDNSIRALMGATKREHDWRNYSVTSTGSANAYVLTYSVAPDAYYTGQRFAFKTNFAVTGAATVNVNSLGAKTIKKIIAGAKTDIASGDIASGDYIDLVYDGTDFVWVNRGATSYTVNGLTEETSVDSADMLGGYDASGTAERKFSVANVLKSVNTLTEDTTPDYSADFVPTYDASGSAAKKVKLQNVANGVVGVGSNLRTFNNTSTPNSKMDITADEVVLKSGNYAYIARSVSVTVDITASGANGLDTGAEASGTFYYLWLIYNGTTVAGLLSTSATAPTMPATYTHKALVGCVRNDGSSNFIKTTSRGEKVYQAPLVVLSATTPTVAKTFQTLSISAGCPAAAVATSVIAGSTANANEHYGVASDTNMVGQQGAATNASAGVTLSYSGTSLNPTATFKDIPLITAQQIVWTNAAGSATYIYVTEFVLPVGV